MSEYAIANDAGEVVRTAASDMDAVRWFLTEGRRGDHLKATGENLSTLSRELMPDVEFRFNGNGCVIGADGEFIDL